METVRRKMSLNKIAIVGAGTWGTAIGCVLSSNTKNHVVIWSPTGRNLGFLRKRIHPNLKGHPLPDSLIFTDSLQEAADNAQMIIMAVSSDYLIVTLEKCRNHVSADQVIVSVVKGLNADNLEVPSQTIGNFFPENDVVVLTGPSHAEEVIHDLPFGLQMASLSDEAMDKTSEVFSHCNLYLPRSHDVVGAQLGGALKNILAIGYGIGRQLALGANFTALLATCGLQEIKNLAMAKGGREDTFLGLSGFGDLLTTIGSPHSRNRLFGELIGSGYEYHAAIQKVGMVVEGVNALEAALKIGAQANIKIPIIQLIEEVVTGKKKPEVFASLVEELKRSNYC